MTVPSGCRMFTAMRNIAPGVRLCLLFRIRKGPTSLWVRPRTREVFNWVAAPYGAAEARMMRLAGVSTCARLVSPPSSMTASGAEPGGLPSGLQGGSDAVTAVVMPMRCPGAVA